MQEYWKNIDGYDNVYQISSMGKIRHTGYYYKESNKTKYANPKILSQSYTTDGYLVVSLTKDRKTKQFKVHRLIGEYFIPNPENKSQINHINGIKDDNRIENLEWVTPKENTIHAHKTGLCKKKGNAYPVAQLDNNNKIIAVFDSIRSASKHIARSDSNLSKICRKGYGKCGGYGWKYIDKDVYNEFANK